MIKVKYYDTIEPQEFEETFPTKQEAAEWVDRQMSIWHDELMDLYPDADVVWLNRYLDCGDIAEIYIPDTSLTVCCELVIE